MKITIVGMGYVGLANALVLAKNNNVTLYDIDNTKIQNFNNGILPLHEDIFDKYFSTQDLNIIATNHKDEAYSNANIIYLALPTNFNETLNSFETSIIDDVVKDILIFNNKALIVIKSTVPIGYTELLKQKLNYENIIFCPEFLREDKALTDCLNPSRIIIGGKKKLNEFESILRKSCSCDDKNIIYTTNTEAESIKLFSNAYLAMRVSFFNELDTFAYNNNLNVSNIISGICKDPRIGDYYNNPSFGFGGYCLPKDTKQIVSQTKNHNNLLTAILKSNQMRKTFISDVINKSSARIVGVYKLNMKKGSSNSRNSAILDIINNLNAKVIIYEPTLKENTNSFTIESNLKTFKEKCDIILVNRISDDLSDVKHKVFTRDIYSRD